MKKIKNSIKKHKISLSLTVAILFILWLFLWPLNALVEAPGEAIDLQPMVKIDNVQKLKKTKFMITAVSISQAHPISYLQKQFNPHLSIESANSITGGQNNEQFSNVQTVYMNTAINNAIYVGYHHAHREVTKNYQGVYVLSLLPNSDFKGKLEPADLVESINGKRLKQSIEYVKYIKSLPDNAKLTIQFKRNGKNHEVKGQKRQIVPGFNGVGMTMTDDMTVKTNPEIKVDPGEIGGPSGGLMFALQIYSQLEHKSYSFSKVAGTGTIAPNGDVGEIGGIDKKIIAANESGAQVFFAPYVKPTKANLAMEGEKQTNYQVAKKTAEKYAPHMKVVPVKNFNDALNYLENH
ncbi:SepM family pheromone-processing serine protease [Fructilactobacillus frigidiflavus]|uniref:SepM family pheromone-processing serine protease n=3 Tax=Fructilactobacillus frigidiflavus TaxID=3242688 RepID=UPI00375746FE